MNKKIISSNSLKRAMLFCALLSLSTGVSYAGKGGKTSGGGGATGGDSGSTTTTSQCPVPPTATGSVSGEAYSIDIDVSLLSESLSVDVGPIPHAILPPTGGFVIEQAVNIDALDLVHSDTLVNVTTGGVGPAKAGSNSVSVIENLNVLNGLITANALSSVCYSAAYRDANGQDIAISGATGDLLNLTIAGKSIDFDPALTKTVDLVNHLLGILPVKVGEVILNEKIPSGDGANVSAITHNLIHVKLFGEPLGGLLGLGSLLDDVVDGDIIVTSTHCDVNYDIDGNGGGNQPPAENGGFVTGGGQIPSAIGGNKATFGFNARDGKGQLQYIDHNGKDSVKIHGNTVTSFVIDGNCATFSGDIKDGGTYEVTTCDNGEPGTGDTFSITTDFYSNSGTLTHGNIQMH